MFTRLLAIQGAWNYEMLLGNGIGFCVEPALRLLPGGVHSPAFHSALARESRYFNAHPYLASVAVGALARAELDGEPPERIERFRTALVRPARQCRRSARLGGMAAVLLARVARAVRPRRRRRSPSSCCFLVVYNTGISRCASGA